MLTITLPLQSHINWTLIIVIIVSTTLSLNFCISALFIFGRWFVDSCTWSLFCNCLYLFNKMQIIQFSGYSSLLMSFEGSKNSLFLFFLQKWYCNCSIIYFLFCGLFFFWSCYKHKIVPDNSLLLYNSMNYTFWCQSPKDDCHSSFNRSDFLLLDYWSKNSMDNYLIGETR